MVGFGDISIGRCRAILKCETQPRVAFGDWCSTMQIDIPRDGAHDGVWCSPFALVWRQTSFQKVNGHTEFLSVSFDGLKHVAAGLTN
jgi:hypothetical protein